MGEVAVGVPYVAVNSDVAVPKCAGLEIRTPYVSVDSDVTVAKCAILGHKVPYVAVDSAVVMVEDVGQNGASMWEETPLPQLRR